MGFDRRFPLFVTMMGEKHGSFSLPWFAVERAWKNGVQWLRETSSLCRQLVSRRCSVVAISRGLSYIELSFQWMIDIIINEDHEGIIRTIHSNRYNYSGF